MATGARSWGERARACGERMGKRAGRPQSKRGGIVRRAGAHMAMAVLEVLLPRALVCVPNRVALSARAVALASHPFAIVKGAHGGLVRAFAVLHAVHELASVQRAVGEAHRALGLLARRRGGQGLRKRRDIWRGTGLNDRHRIELAGPAPRLPWPNAITRCRRCVAPSAGTAWTRPTGRLRRLCWAATSCHHVGLRVRLRVGLRSVERRRAVARLLGAVRGAAR